MLKKLFLLTILCLFSSLSWGLDLTSDCPDWPPPTTFTHYSIDGYLFTYASVDSYTHPYDHPDRKSIDPDCFPSYLYVTKPEKDIAQGESEESLHFREIYKSEYVRLELIKELAIRDEKYVIFKTDNLGTSDSSNVIFSTKPNFKYITSIGSEFISFTKDGFITEEHRDPDEIKDCDYSMATWPRSTYIYTFTTNGLKKKLDPPNSFWEWCCKCW